MTRIMHGNYPQIALCFLTAKSAKMLRKKRKEIYSLYVNKCSKL